MEDAGTIQELAKHWEVLISMLIIGLVQVTKTALPKIPARVIPLVSVLLGIGFMFGLVGLTLDACIAGMMIGFAASGIWSSGRTVVNEGGGN